MSNFISAKKTVLLVTVWLSKHLLMCFCICSAFHVHHHHGADEVRAGVCQSSEMQFVEACGYNGCGESEQQHSLLHISDDDNSENIQENPTAGSEVYFPSAEKRFIAAWKESIFVRHIFAKKTISARLYTMRC